MVYDLTFIGVLAALARELSPEDARQCNYDQIRKIIGKYDCWLPLVFGKWGFFQKSGVEKIAVLRMGAIIGMLNVERVRFTDLFGYGGPLVPAADIKNLVQWLFYFVGLIPTGDRLGQDRRLSHNAETWINTLRQDKNIVAYIIQELEQYQHTLTNLSDWAERLKTRIIGTGTWGRLS